MKQQFFVKLKEVRDLIGTGETDAAMQGVDLAWELAGTDEGLQDLAHGLGNEVQRAIFEKYFGDIRE